MGVGVVMDIRTLFLASSILAVFIAAGMSWLAVAQPRNRYIRAWAVSNCLFAAAQIAAALRGTLIPEWLSVALTSPSFFLSAHSALLGFHALLGSQRFRLTSLAVTIIGSVLLWGLFAAGVELPLRAAAFSALQAVQVFALVRVTLHNDRPALRWPLRLAGAAFGLDGLLLAVRGTAAAIWPSVPATQGSNHLAEAILLMLFGLFSVSINYAYVWLIIADAADRHSQEQRRLLEEVEATRAALERQTVDLRAAKLEAEAASAAKSIFLATMSHEIRTPLNGVIGFADLLLQSPLSTEQKRFVQLQREAGMGLLTVINDILDFSKLEAGKFQIEPVDADFPALFKSCVSLFQPAAKEKGLDLTIEIDPSVPQRGRLDGYRLRQSLSNLLSNAVKFTKSGSIVLHAEGLVVDGETRLRLAVRDTGIGIPADKLGKLFQHFSQVDGSISREFGGTGLGLAISRRIIGLMGGTLDVASILGTGSVFTLEVPYQTALLHMPAPTAAEPIAAQRRQRVLVAEDVVPNQIMIEIVLGKAGHDATVVENGALAVEAVQRGDFDIVLMDLQMPVMDGLEATRRIRALPCPAARVPIVALTANVMPDEIAACRAVGMQAHLAKPIDAAALIALIDRLGAAATAASFSPE